MAKPTIALLFALMLAACAHDETTKACEKIACGGDVNSCISQREQNLGEIGGRCGDAGTQAALDVYACEGTLTCDNKATFATACQAELAAYDDVRAKGSAGCKGAPDVIAP